MPRQRSFGIGGPSFNEMAHHDKAVVLSYAYDYSKTVTQPTIGVARTYGPGRPDLQVPRRQRTPRSVLLAPPTGSGQFNWRIIPMHSSCLVEGTLIQTNVVSKLSRGSKSATWSFPWILRQRRFREACDSNHCSYSESIWDIKCRNGNMISATGGHYWWVVGQGWSAAES